MVVQTREAVNTTYYVHTSVSQCRVELSARVLPSVDAEREEGQY
jgi:hypothetical protein